MTDADKSVFIQNMQAASKTTHSLQCNFTQKKNSSLLDEAVVSNGMMYFKAPDALRWEYTSPQAYAFVMNQGQSVVKNNKGITNLDAQSSQMIKNMTEMIMGMINGKGLIDNKNFTTSYYTNQKQVRIILTPKNSKIKMLFRSIQVYVNPKTYLANLIEMNEAGGDVTSISLTNIKKNIAIADDIFNIK
jgi:outer membrane lipoprotein carrier protein